MISFRKQNLWMAGILVAGALSSGCASKPPYDYTAYRAHQPKSILILPPFNEGTDIRGAYSYLSTVTRPVAEMGYYVFPVEIVDKLMKENGLPTPGEMQQVSLKKIAEIINPDAVMYLTLEQYGSKFHVVSSDVNVTVKGKLVDVRSGTTIWNGASTATESSGSSGSGSLLGALITTAVAQAINSGTDRAHDLCPAANASLFRTPDHGLLPGPYSPDFQARAQ